MDTSGYQVSDLENFEFWWEKVQLDVDAVFRPGTDTPFSSTAFEDLEMGGGPVKNTNLFDEEEDKENSGKPAQPPALLRSR